MLSKPSKLVLGNCGIVCPAGVDGPLAKEQPVRFQRDGRERQGSLSTILHCRVGRMARPAVLMWECQRSTIGPVSRPVPFDHSDDVIFDRLRSCFYTLAEWCTLPETSAPAEWTTPPE